MTSYLPTIARTSGACIALLDMGPKGRVSSKKLGKLNKKIRQSKRKHNNLVSKQNSIKKKISDLKGLCEPEVLNEPEELLNPAELKQAFDRAYRSYRINGRSRMDIDTLLDQIRQNL